MNAKQRRKKRRAEERELASRIDNDTESTDDVSVEEQKSALVNKYFEAPEKDSEEKAVDEGEEEKGLFGPTSFEEIDEQRAIEEQSRKVRGVLFDAERITSNIIYDPEMNVGEKTSALKKVANQLSNRIGAASVKENEEFVFELYEAKSLLLEIEEGLDLADKAEDIVGKLAKNTEEDFAFTAFDGEKNINKYPIHNRAAIRSSLKEVIKDLGGDGTGRDLAKEALPFIRDAARTIGVGVPSGDNKSSVMVMKDNTGSYRWFGWVSNNFKDREGEILSEDAHKDYIAFLDDKPQFAPTFRMWHTKGTDREKQADWWAYEKGFLLMSGQLTEKEAEGLIRVSAKEKLGMSHGFFVLKRNAENPTIIEKYRTFEVSDLPVSKAANLWTSVDTISKELEIMDKSRTDYIAAQLGDEFVQSVEADTEKAQTDLRNAGVEEKEISEETPIAEEKTDAAESADEEVKETSSAGDAVAAIVAEFGKEYDMEGLSEWVTEAKEAFAKIEVLEKKVEDLSKSEDEKIAEKLTPPVAKSFGWSRASQSEETLLDKENDEDELLKEEAPTSGWFGEQFGSEALPQ